MTSRLLLTGASGFVGPHVLRAFRREGWEVVAAVRDVAAEVAVLPADAPRVFFDLRDGSTIDRALAEAAPDAVLHLAGESNVARAWRDPIATWEINALGTLRFLEATRRRAPGALFVCIGSGDIYGRVEPAELPLGEGRPPRPNNPYAASKLAAEVATLAFGASEPRVLTLRPFAHTGPGQTTAFACPAFAHQIARIEAGAQEAVLRVGNLDARRDYTDVRDMAEAYLLAVTRGLTGGPYNICSGTSRSMRELLDRLLGLYRGSHTIRVEIDPDRLRPTDTPDIRGDASRFRTATGWAPRVPVERTLADLLDHERAIVAGAPAASAAG